MLAVFIFFLLETQILSSLKTIRKNITLTLTENLFPHSGCHKKCTHPPLKKDPTGSLPATITAAALASDPSLGPGSVLLLTRFAILTCSPGAHAKFACITPANIDQVFAPQAPRSRPPQPTAPVRTYNDDPDYYVDIASGPAHCLQEAPPQGAGRGRALGRGRVGEEEGALPWVAGRGAAAEAPWESGESECDASRLPWPPEQRHDGAQGPGHPDFPVGLGARARAAEEAEEMDLWATAAGGNESFPPPFSRPHPQPGARALHEEPGSLRGWAQAGAAGAGGRVDPPLWGATAAAAASAEAAFEFGQVQPQPQGLDGHVRPGSVRMHAGFNFPAAAGPPGPAASLQAADHELPPYAYGDVHGAPAGYGAWPAAADPDARSGFVEPVGVGAGSGPSQAAGMHMAVVGGGDIHGRSGHAYGEARTQGPARDRTHHAHAQAAAGGDQCGDDLDVEL